MKVHVVHAHPVETSFNRALFATVVDALSAAGHEVDPLDLYAENFEAVMSREERLNYHDVPGNLTPAIKPYVDRLRNADALVFVHPVWNYGYPAILKGYFDRIFVPGVSFHLIGGRDSESGKLVPALTNIKKTAFVTTYGGNWWRTKVMGDPPKTIANRWGWATFGQRPLYLAHYDMNNQTPEKLEGFLTRVRTAMNGF
jgi:NAD(P)H dehydrogenase (quinone)